MEASPTPRKRRRTIKHSSAAKAVQAMAAMEEAKASEVALPLPSTPLKHSAPSKPKPPPPPPQPPQEGGGPATAPRAFARNPAPARSPQLPVVHTGKAAADILVCWLAATIAEAPVQSNPVAVDAEEEGRLECAMESLALLLGAVGGDAGMVTPKLACFLLDHRTRVAHAAGRALLGLVQASSGNVSALVRLLVGQRGAAGEEGEEEEAVPLLLVCRKLGDYRTEWRCWALELLLDALPLSAQAGLLSSTHRAAVVGMLADPSREVRHLAAGALGSAERRDMAALFLGDASAVHVKAIVWLLDETRLSMREAAVQASRGTTLDAKYACASLPVSDSQPRRHTNTQMLALLPPTTQPTILQLLAPTLTSTVRGTRYFAMEALRRGLPMPFGHEPNDDAQRICVRRGMWADGPHKVLIEPPYSIGLAIDTFLPLHPVCPSITVLRRLVEDPTPCVRRAAAAVLVGLPLPAVAEWRVIEKLLALASSSRGGRADRVQAATALGVVARCVLTSKKPLLT